MAPQMAKTGKVKQTQGIEMSRRYRSRTGANRKIVKFQVTAEEFDMIMEASTKARQTLSAYCAERILDPLYEANEPK